MSPFFTNVSLTTKLSLLVTVTVLAVLGILAVYFDDFLKTSFVERADKQMQHGYERLAATLRDMEDGLRAGIALIEDDQEAIASIEQVNRYRDADDYQRYSIDDAKKAIANGLLDRVKRSLNNDIAVYDQSGDLIALATKQTGRYRLYFVSSAGGERRLYQRFDQQRDFVPARSPLPPAISTISTRNSGPVVSDDGVTRYRRLDDKLVIKVQQGLTEPRQGRVIARVEMANLLDQDYFDELSKDLGIAIRMSFDPVYAPAAQSFKAGWGVPTVELRPTEAAYEAVMRLPVGQDWAYLVARLNKAELTTVLNQNRRHFLLLLVLVAAATLLLMRYLIHRGLTRPLDALMGQIRRIEQRDYRSVQTLTTGDELEAISSGVNELAKAVQEREYSLERSRQELLHLSNHDTLTNLPNRRFFGERLNHALELAKRRNERLAVFFFDLDHFKLVNDTLGHDVGDELLIEVAKRLSGRVRKVDTLARIGGDEFTILFENPRQLSDLEAIVSKFLAAFRQPFHCRGHSISSTVSIGISVYPNDGEDSVTLVKHADLAMYKSKDNGRNSYSFFSKELSDAIGQRASMSHALKEAIKDGNQFELYYQPKVPLQGSKGLAVEALIRWHRPGYGLVEPGRFISLAEETGLIVPIGDWVLHQGCSDFVRLRREGVPLSHISINVSNVQMRHDDMIPAVRRAIDQSGIGNGELELEITESYIATDVEDALNALRDLRAMEVKLAVDDFGTGYSSMSYLQQLPVTRVKIDKSFVEGLPRNRDSVAITRAIIGLAKSFNLQVTAEGVEYQEQTGFLQTEGCDEAQGYYYAKPLPMDQLAGFFATHIETAEVVPFDSARDSGESAP